MRPKVTCWNHKTIISLEELLINHIIKDFFLLFLLLGSRRYGGNRFSFLFTLFYVHKVVKIIKGSIL